MMKKNLWKILLVLCTVITFYGVFTAPASDEDILKRELQKNAETLQKKEDIDVSDGSIVKAAKKSEKAEPETTPFKSSFRKNTSSEGIQKKITVIGDSVFLGAALEFKKLQKNSVIDAKISRQVCQALNVAKRLKKKGKLGDMVIISLGTNGPFNIKTGEALIDYLGTDKQIFWINAYSKKKEIPDSVNQTIQKLGKKYKNLSVISWDREGKKHPGWFYQDGTHLNEKGQKGFARYIAHCISEH